MAPDLEIPDGIPAKVSIGWHPVRWPYRSPQQFEAGRRAASTALASAGSVDRVVPRDPGGRPRFPRGFPGSISHTDRIATAVVVPGAESVGVDIENATIGLRVARFVLRERERRTLLPPWGTFGTRELFCAKEAAFKALNGTRALGEFLFWAIELRQCDGALLASYRDVRVPVWVRSAAGCSLAVAIVEGTVRRMGERNTMDRDILEVVDDLFRRRLQVTELDPEAPLVEYGLDSIRSIDLVVEMESLFDVAISDEQAVAMRTLRDVVAQITASLTVRVGQGRSEV